MKKDILLIGATHGDESFSIPVLDTYLTHPHVDVVIGNPRALLQKKRFIDADLNRSAPGNLTSFLYEERRAAELLEISKQYRYTIDVHGSEKDVGIFIIVTNPTKENLILASMLRIPKIVIWPSISPEQEGPLSEYMRCGIEIECGVKDDPRITAELDKILKDFVTNYAERENIGWQKRLEQKKIYQMYGSLKKFEVENSTQLLEFKEVTCNNETFTPLFIGSYPYADILCYKLKLVSLEQLLERT